MVYAALSPDCLHKLPYTHNYSTRINLSQGSSLDSLMLYGVELSSRAELHGSQTNSREVVRRFFGYCSYRLTRQTLNLTAVFLLI
jgi:hypothetical protein